MIPLLEAIKKLLWEQWDPIGVNCTDCPRDEYDSYAFGVWAMLMRRASVDEIADYLADLETGHIGLSFNSGRALVVAQAAVDLLGEPQDK